MTVLSVACKRKFGMAMIVVKMWVSSWLKMRTMWRSVRVSTTLMTYVPAGRVCAPTPGTSKGALNVTTVFLSQSAADAVGSASKQIANMDAVSKHLVKSFIGTFSLNTG